MKMNLKLEVSLDGEGDEMECQCCSQLNGFAPSDTRPTQGRDSPGFYPMHGLPPLVPPLQRRLPEQADEND